MNNTKLRENDIEYIFIDLLKDQGYKHFFGPDIAPYTENAQREGFDSVVLEKHFKESLKRLNPEVVESARAEAYQKVVNLAGADVMDNNEKFHTMLSEGITVTYGAGDDERSEIVRLIDVENPENNSFWVVNQFEIKENKNHKIPDVVVFVNGLPLVLVELKSATSEKATLDNAFTQIQNYKKAIPSIFYYNSLIIISDGGVAKTSSLSAPFSRFLAWKGPKERHGELFQMGTMVEEMLKKDVLLKLIRYNTVFETEEEKNEKTGLVQQVKIKKVAAYHQYYAVQKSVEETIRATDENGDQKVGVV
jgi:type I restriction enzyme R subunit